MPRHNRGPHISYRADRAAWEIIDYQGGRRKRLSTGHSCREDAQEKLVEILSGRKPDAPSHKITIGEIMAYYCTERAPHIARPDHAAFFTERLAPFWGDKTVSAVTRGECQRYDRARRAASAPKKLSNATIRRELEHLRACLSFARGEGLIDTTPEIWLPTRPPSRQRWITHHEAARLIRAARKAPMACEYLPLFILISLYTGARKSAILSLRWPQIDLDRGIIDFRDGQVSHTKARSVIPIPRRLHRELIRARATRGTDIGYVIHRTRKTTINGETHLRQYPIDDVKKSFGEACAAAGLSGVSPHTLRHTAASWMVQKGVPLNKIAHYLGHSSTAMVERTYGHMAPHHLREAADSYG